MLGNLSNTFAGKAAAALVAIPLLFNPLAAGAQDINQTPTQLASTNAGQAVAQEGKSVILRVGRGVDMDDVNLTAAALNSQGCPTTVTDGGRYKRIIAEVDGKTTLPLKHSDSAGSLALEWCLDQS